MKPGDLVRVVYEAQGFNSEIYFSCGEIGLIVGEAENSYERTRDDARVFLVYFSAYEIVEVFFEYYIKPLEIGVPE